MKAPAVDDLRSADCAPHFIGFVGIALPAFLPVLAHWPELGWRLARDSWGAGLATEAATAVRDRALADGDFTQLISIIHPDNARSIRLAQKLSMSREEQVRNPVLGRDVDVWSIRRPAGPPPTTDRQSIASASIVRATAVASATVAASSAASTAAEAPA